MNALYSVCSSEPVEIVDGVMQSWAVNLKEKGAEILSVGDHLLETCTDRDIVNSAVQIMCYAALPTWDLARLPKSRPKSWDRVFTPNTKKRYLLCSYSKRKGRNRASAK